MNHSLSLATRAIAAAILGSIALAAPAAENPYALPVGTTLVYGTTATLTMEAGERKQTQSIAFRPEYVVLDEKADVRTIFCSVDAGNADTYTTEPLSPAGRFTFELKADATVGERVAGFSPRGLPGWRPALEFPSYIDDGATTAIVDTTLGAPVEVSITKTESDGVVTFTLAKVDDESTDTEEDAAIKVYKAVVVYSPADKQVKSHTTTLEAEVPQGNFGVAKLKMDVRSEAKERSTVAAADMETLQKDVLAGIKVMESLQQGAMREGKLPDDLGQYLKDHPAGRFSKIFRELKESFEMQAAMEKNAANVAEGKPAPDFTAKTIDGDTIKLSDLKGKVVLLDFWATWCAPCIAELPTLVEMHKTHADKDFVMIGISADHDEETLVEFVKSKEVKWKQIYDGEAKEGTPRYVYGVNSFPTMVLIGRDGKIASTELRGEELVAAVEKLLETK